MVIKVVDEAANKEVDEEVDEVANKEVDGEVNGDVNGEAIAAPELPCPAGGDGIP